MTFDEPLPVISSSEATFFCGPVEDKELQVDRSTIMIYEYDISMRIQFCESAAEHGQRDRLYEITRTPCGVIDRLQR